MPQATLPSDYAERVYAGVLGKIIGVYLGRPIEGWDHKTILERLGEVDYYVNDRLNVPLVVTDDDITGTFTFVRALEDFLDRPSREPRSDVRAYVLEHFTPRHVADAWLNYIVENRTILWWGGLGMSTEHTAYLRLKQGVQPPRSGSAELNTKLVAEQIGAQIFIDGWAMVSPGDPGLAAELARRAACVSHDGEAVYAAQVVAVMEALAFVEADVEKLLDAAVGFIPKDSVIARMIADLRAFHAKEPDDWKKCFAEVLQKHYGYDKYGGICHVVPNHGVIILALLYGNDSFQRSLMIANTCGWDTDCNSGNVGCLMGIKNGLAGIDAGADFRTPVADRIYLPTADGGSSITDAVREAIRIANIGRRLADQPVVAPKGGARFHGSFPGNHQAWVVEDSDDCRGEIRVRPALRWYGGKQINGVGITAPHHAAGRVARAATNTFMPPEALNMPAYALVSSPTIYPGQRVRASLWLVSPTTGGEAIRERMQRLAGSPPPGPKSPPLAEPGETEDQRRMREIIRATEDEQVVRQGPVQRPEALAAVTVRPYVRHYNAENGLSRIYGEATHLLGRAERVIEWTVPDAGGQPIAEVGFEFAAPYRVEASVDIDSVTWGGTPSVTFEQPESGGTVWQRQWVDAMSHVYWRDPTTWVSDAGRGMLITGTREWVDYVVSTEITPNMLTACGLAARVQGLRRYYALMLCDDGTAKLVKVLDGETVLASRAFAWEFNRAYPMTLEVKGQTIRGRIGADFVLEATDADLANGGIALVCDDGRGSNGPVTVRPA
jgi:ADP-ribosylglycohydrolase